jgi:hypothetical protein
MTTAKTVKIESTSEDFMLEDGDRINGFEIEVVEEGDWEDGGKYQYLQSIIRFPEWSPEKFFSYNLTRSGSYFSDYEYDRPSELYEVVKKEKITHEWVSA